MTKKPTRAEKLAFKIVKAKIFTELSLELLQRKAEEGERIGMDDLQPLTFAISDWSMASKKALKMLSKTGGHR